MKTVFQNNLFKTVFLGASLTLVDAQVSKAALLAGWNFNTNTFVSHGSGTLDLSTLANAGDVSITGVGTSQNVVSGDNNGSALLITAGTGSRENGHSITFSLSMSGYQDLVLTYATARSSTGFTDQNWSYSTDGTAYTSFSIINGIPTFVNAGSYAVETVNFSSISGLNNDSSIWIRLTLSGATGGSDRFDNIQFNVSDAIVPEPAEWGLISSIGLLGLCGLRAWREQKQKTEIKC